VENEQSKRPPHAKRALHGLVGCGAAPRCVSGIEIATNENAISGSREAKNFVPIEKNVLPKSAYLQEGRQK
jgi:hypothetical protein